MKTLRRLFAVIGAAALLAPVGCVQLCGQRITLNYDKQNDRFMCLLHYDGIHDSGSDRWGDGAKQVPQFVEQGNVLIVDWIGHIRMKDVAEVARNEEKPEDVRIFAAKFLQAMKVTRIGRYREPDGRIGAAQLIIFSRPDELLAAANKAMDASILADAEGGKDGDADWERTQRLIVQAAKKGRKWVTRNGSAIGVSLPVHPTEWARGKAAALVQLFGAESGIDRGAQLLSSAPLSITESSAEATIRLGVPERPTTLRLSLRDDYLPNLAEVIDKHVPEDLDRMLADHLLGVRERPVPPGITAIGDWGPPEEAVRALWSVAKGGGEEEKSAALKLLGQWGAKWGAEHGDPPAPAANEDPAAYLAGWEKWYRLMKLFPLEEEEEKEGGEGPQ